MTAIERMRAELAGALVSGYDADQEWRCSGTDGYVVFGDYADEGEPDLLIRVLSAEYPDKVARFIAHAPTYLAALLDVAEAAQEFLDADIEVDSVATSPSAFTRYWESRTALAEKIAAVIPQVCPDKGEE